MDEIKVFKKKRQATQSPMFGKVPPQVVPLEMVVLGAIMLEARAFEIIAELLEADHFYKEAHQLIFRAMASLKNKNAPIDILTVTEELKTLGKLDLIGGPYYLIKLTKEVVSAANIEQHAKYIVEKFISREIIRIGMEMIESGYDDESDAFELIDKAEESIASLSDRNMKSDYKHISDPIKNVLEKIEYLKTVPDEIIGVPSGFQGLDSKTHGWQDTDLIIIAARPSVGKTAFALNIAKGAALHPTKPVGVGFFSLEMSAEQLSQRLLSAQSGIELDKIQTGRLNSHDTILLINQGADPLTRGKIYVDDTGSLNIFELRAKARRMKERHGVGMIIIDYLQLMSGTHESKGNREQEISNISRELKKLGKSLRIPIIALSQLSREVEKRGSGKRMPQLSDLRESGAIEQDADLVMFLYRPSDDELKIDPQLPKNIGTGKIAKHRNGALAEIDFYISNNIQRWTEVGDNFTPIDRNDAFNNSQPEVIDDLPF